MTKQIGDIRERGGRYEILMATGSGGDQWEPAATEYVRCRYLEGGWDGEVFPVSIADALRAEGWISPEEELPLCEEWIEWGIDDFSLRSIQCRLRDGHDGPHRAGNLSWDESWGEDT